MGKLTTKEASERGHLGGLAKAANHDPNEYMKHVRAAFVGRFDSPEALSAHMSELGRKSWKSRRKKSGSRLVE